MDRIEIYAEAAAPYLLAALQNPEDFGLTWYSPQGVRTVQVIEGGKLLDTIREIYQPDGIFEGEQEYVLATLAPGSWLLLQTGWGHRRHYKLHTMDGKTYLRAPSGEDEKPHWDEWSKFLPATQAIKAVEDELNTCVQWPSNGYVGVPGEVIRVLDLPAMQVPGKHLKQLLEYSHSFPTGASDGKTWRRKVLFEDGNQGWMVMRYVCLPDSLDLFAVMAWRAEIIHPEMESV